MKPLIAACTVALALAACSKPDPQPADGKPAASAAAEDAATRAKAGFDDAVAKGNWPLAKAQADVLMSQHPGTRAAQAVQAQYGDIKARSDAEREGKRTAALWTYQSEPAKGGQQLSASIYARDNLDTGAGPKPVRLIFRDHPDWGKSSYLVLQAGDFDCYGGCKVQVKVDDAAPKPMAASRPKTDEAIAMFIEDEKALWRIAKDAKVISIEFPVKGQGRKTAVFEVGGLDKSRLPKWD